MRLSGVSVLTLARKPSLYSCSLLIGYGVWKYDIAGHA